MHIFGNKSPNARKGRLSGGISLYFRDYLTDKITVVEQNQNGIMWIKIRQELFEHNQDVYLCNVYIPPSCSKLRKKDDFDFFETLEQGIISFQTQGKVLLTGDFNSRSSNFTDLLDFDKYLDDEQDYLNCSTLQLQPRVN